MYKYYDLIINFKNVTLAYTCIYNNNMELAL